MKAVCSQCLRVLPIDEATLLEATEGRHMTTVYASDHLAFPGIGLPRLGTECGSCGASVPIAVDDDVADSLPEAEPAQAEALTSARRWSTAAMIAGGFSGMLLPVLACLMLVTMGVAMFLFPVLVPGFLTGFLCALRARRIEASVGAYTTRTKSAYVLNAIGLGASGVFSLIAGCIAAIAYFGH